MRELIAGKEIFHGIVVFVNQFRVDRERVVVSRRRRNSSMREAKLKKRVIVSFKRHEAYETRFKLNRSYSFDLTLPFQVVTSFNGQSQLST